MRSMKATARLGLAGLLCTLVITAPGCNEKGGAEKFVGTWTYAGAIDPNCQGASPVDLTGDTVTITAPDSSHLKVELAGICTVNFSVDGFTASASGGQSCTLEIPGVGPAPITVTSWTLTMTGDDVITSSFTGSALICFPSGTGTLTRQSDAGA
jgi:hypothetical protein